MSFHKIKSFTLPEMLIVMVITAIIVGIAFSVLNLVRKEIAIIDENYSRKTKLLFLEQNLWQDFNTFTDIQFIPKQNKLMFSNPLDTIVYDFDEKFVKRQQDTLFVSVLVDTLYFHGNTALGGQIDAIRLSCDKDFPEYAIFIFKQNDATLFINNDGI